ncbi:MAG: hypothetical protein A2991_01715 [Candidatus Terrybacteria bacterium RIFCSPLOWO2_01_FULL_58_14]|uniref:Peripheral subunit-binding (PSBD) domain-containing protein n=1 Tax=Candidatus Terrybacteria bacterium RIFCSPLOWO2_01_FULL_58_14 TaxID=1802369 RepID=A0A1G2PY91_9BACT|nr:MAG: hypothetical protein A2991_01715 [Candidatus Terrybacteria bacterium RIFCSPLOWO2_01_FULL_58_14]
MNDQIQTTPPASPKASQRVNAGDLVRQAAQAERNAQIAKAEQLVEQLDQAEEQIGQYETAERILRSRNKDLTPQQRTALDGLRSQAVELREKLEAAGEDTARIAQFRGVRRTLRVFSDKGRHPETPSLPDYAEAVHGLLKVTDHAVVTQEELEGARSRKQDGHFVFCDCPDHRDTSYTVSRTDGSPATFRGTYFRFDSYERSPAVRSAVFFALRTRNRIRSAERQAAEERRGLLANATGVKAEDILALTCSGLVAVPVLFRDGKSAGQLVLEIVDRTVTLKAATNRGMASILQECMGQSLTAENRRDGGPGYFFKGPVRLYHILDQSAREPASEEQARALQERFRPQPPMASAAPSPAHAEPERDETPRGRRSRHEPSLDEEELDAEDEAVVAEALGNNEDDTAEPQSYSSGPGEEGASPFAALAPLKASPQARKLAGELGVDLGTIIDGTGKDGAITVSDVRNASAAAPIQ